MSQLEQSDPRRVETHMQGDSAGLSDFLTVAASIFIAELTDKDALLILSLATRFRPKLVFAAGALAFMLTSAIIVTVGQFLINFVPLSLITLAGGTIMIAYGFWSFVNTKDAEEIARVERKLSAKASNGAIAVFLTAVAFLIILDLAGDATEVLTILFVARFGDGIIVYAAAVTALVAATAVETTVGSRLSGLISEGRFRFVSLFLFVIIGAIAILTVIVRV